MGNGPVGTIYENEPGFDRDAKIDINLAKVIFVKVLKATETSSIFHVYYNKKSCVLKVFHNNGDPGYADDGFRDFNRSRSEIRAYCNLKRFGVCDSGYVPKFYGYMESINPVSCSPHLDAFRDDSSFPSAILIEYLPNPEMMNCVTYSKERMQSAIIGIQQIHSALVEHNDCYPKNILIVPGKPERVVWVDFDIAIVYHNMALIGDRERGWLESETECVKSYGVKLEDDQKEGLPPNTKYY